MWFLVTIVLQTFVNNDRIITSRIIDSYNFSEVIFLGTGTENRATEFNEKLNQFIEKKIRPLRTRERNVVLISVSHSQL